MNITVLGSRGMLGTAVTKYFKNKGHQVNSISRINFDIAKDSMDKLESLIADSELVINCAGVIKPRISAMSIEDVLVVNSVFPHNLSKLSKKLNQKLIHITTDCVYTGNKGKYDENDYFDANDVYGLTKKAGEANGCMVLRTSIIGEEEGEGRSLLEWVRTMDGKDAKGFLNHWWNGVTTSYLAEVIDSIIENGLYEEGLFHLHSPNTLNKFELVSAIAKTYNVNINLESVLVETPCDRSMSSIYDLSSKVVTKKIEDQIDEMKLFFENSR